MNHDLIKQLQSLSPTEGEGGYVSLRTSEDHEKLMKLAIPMRQEILAMAKEIEELREENRKLKDYINPPKKDSFFDGFKVGQRD